MYVGSKASFIRSLMIGKVSEITGAAHEPRYETMFLQGEWREESSSEEEDDKMKDRNKERERETNREKKRRIESMIYNEIW